MYSNSAHTHEPCFKNLLICKTGLISGFYFYYMKKWFLGFIVLFAAILITFYFLGASSNPVTYTMVVNANKNTVFRCLTNQSLLQKWWTGNHETITAVAGKSLQVSGDAAFVITPNTFDVVSIAIEKKQQPIQSFITILPLQHDSSLLSWKAELPAGGFFTRIQNYFKAKNVKENMTSVLERFQRFMQNEKNIYGLSIKHEKVTDTLLVVTKLRDGEKPSAERYYGLIKNLRTYSASHGAQETNYPMLHIFATAGNQYETMVALPINRVMPDNGAVVFRRMVPGNIMVAEVKGGPGAIEEGFRQLDFYMNEHQLQQPGLPFQSLVTDRLAEPDTSKWVTKLYYPVL